MPATKAPPKVNAYSFSRIKTWSQCALSYKLEYKDKVGKDTSAAMELGAGAHEFFEKWHTFIGGLTPEQRKLAQADEAEIVAMASACWHEESRSTESFKEHIENCKAFAKSDVYDDKWDRTDCEIEIAFDKDWNQVSWMDPSVRFRAKLDLLETSGDHARITDYKNSFAGKLDTTQTEIYAWCVSLINPKLKTIEVVYHYVKSGFRESKTLNVADLGIVKVQIESLMMAIDKDKKAKPKPGSRCLSCMVASFCTAKATDLVAITTQKQAETLAAEVAMLDAQHSAKMKSLKAWAEKHGEIHSAGLVYAHWPREKFALNIPEFLNLCVANDIDPSKYLSSSATTIKKLCKDKPELSEIIANMTEVEQSLSFYARKEDAE